MVPLTCLSMAEIRWTDLRTSCGVAWRAWRKGLFKGSCREAGDLHQAVMIYIASHQVHQIISGLALHSLIRHYGTFCYVTSICAFYVDGYIWST